MGLIRRRNFDGTKNIRILTPNGPEICSLTLCQRGIHQFFDRYFNSETLGDELRDSFSPRITVSLGGSGFSYEDQLPNLVCFQCSSAENGKCFRSNSQSQSWRSIPAKRDKAKNGSPGLSARTISLSISPTAGPCLKPCPEPPPASQTLAAAGWRSRMK